MTLKGGMGKGYKVIELWKDAYPSLSEVDDANKRPAAILRQVSEIGF